MHCSISHIEVAVDFEDTEDQGNAISGDSLFFFGETDKSVRMLRKSRKTSEGAGFIPFHCARLSKRVYT
jgi:hypothetical protein